MTTYILAVGKLEKAILKPITEGEITNLLILLPKSEKSSEVVGKLRKLNIQFETVYLCEDEFYNNINFLSKLIKSKERVVLGLTKDSNYSISLALLYAGLNNEDKVERIYYIDEDMILTLPKIANYTLTNAEKRVLEVLDNKVMTISEIAKELNLTTSAISRLVNSLENKGLVQTNKIRRKKYVKSLCVYR